MVFIKLVPNSRNRQAIIKKGHQHFLIMLVKELVWSQESHCMLRPRQ